MEIKIGNPDWQYAKCEVCGMWVWGRVNGDAHLCASPCRMYGLERGDVPYQDDGIPLRINLDEENGDRV